MFAIAASSSSRNASATAGLRAKYQARAASASSAASGCSRTVWLVTRSTRQASLHHFPRNALHGAGIELLGAALDLSAPIRSAQSCSGRDSALRRISSRDVATAKAYSCAKRSDTCPLTVKLRGHATAPDQRHGRTLSSSARGAQPPGHHGPLQRLLDGTVTQ